MYIRFFIVIFAVFLTASSRELYAEADGYFLAQSHLGLSTESRRDPERSEVSGSSLMLDLWYAHERMYPRLGLRTVGQGSLSQSKSFSRLSTGPVVAMPLEILASSITLFVANSSESSRTGLDNTSVRSTTTRSSSFGVGWEHERPIIDGRAWICWGVFVQWHQAPSEAEGPSAVAAASFFGGNSSMSRMIEVSLRTRL